MRADLVGDHFCSAVAWRASRLRVLSFGKSDAQSVRSPAGCLRERTLGCEILCERCAEPRMCAAGLAFSSGLAAQTTITNSFLKSGEHIICGDDVYGGTNRYFRCAVTALTPAEIAPRPVRSRVALPAMGITTSLVDFNAEVCLRTVLLTVMCIQSPTLDFAHRARLRRRSLRTRPR